LCLQGYTEFNAIFRLPVTLGKILSVEYLGISYDYQKNAII